MNLIDYQLWQFSESKRNIFAPFNTSSQLWFPWKQISLFHKFSIFILIYISLVLLEIDCDFIRNFKRKIAAANGTRDTRQTCLAFCTQILTSRRCGCQSNRLAYNVANVSYCSMIDELGCAETIWSSPSDINNECMDKCPLVFIHALQDNEISNEACYNSVFELLSSSFA